MPTSQPATDRPRHLPPRSMVPRVLGIVSVCAMVLASVAALSFWLLLSDPVTAAAVMERRDLIPVVQALASALGRAFQAMLSLL